MTRFLAFTYAAILMLCFDSAASLPELCRAQETLVPFSSLTTLGFSTEQLLGNITLSRSRCMAWDNDEVARGIVSFVPTTDLARVITYVDDGDCMHPSPSMSIDGILHVHTDDQTINAEWPAKLTAVDVSSANIELEIRDHQGIPGPEPWEMTPRTYFSLKFEGAHIDGTMYRLSGTPFPCSIELPVPVTCFRVGSYFIGNLGRGLYTPFIPLRGFSEEAMECAEEPIG